MADGYARTVRTRNGTQGMRCGNQNDPLPSSTLAFALENVDAFH